MASGSPREVTPVNVGTPPWSDGHTIERDQRTLSDPVYEPFFSGNNVTVTTFLGLRYRLAASLTDATVSFL
jgi:hypothetical protein